MKAAAGALLLAATLAAGAQAAELPVDLELVFAVDVSGSIDPDEARLQRDGYVAALTDPQVIKAIRSGPNRRIAAAYFEWASASHRTLVVGWRAIESDESAAAFAAELTRARIAIGQRTSISGAIEFAMPMFEDNGFEGARRVIDISGDGPNNDGLPIDVVRDAAIKRGITINGLPIINDRPNGFGFPTLPDLDLYYRGCVIGGAGAFVVVANSFADFGAAIRRKLILEIAGRPAAPAPMRALERPPVLPAATPPRLSPRLQTLPVQYAYDQGCDIGERQSRQFWRNRFNSPD